jgi:UDP-glucose 4-epimerase
MKSNSNKKSKPVILVTGGTGYIGSHAVVSLIAAGYEPVIVDNLSNSKESVLERIFEITGYRPLFYKADLHDRGVLRSIFKKNKIEAVIHFAGFKAVGESVAQPLKYYENNIGSAISLISVMIEYGVKRIIFSSSASVYGDSATIAVKENFPASPTNPYSRTKLMVEQLLGDIYVADPVWRIAILRYFNPAGAHESGQIGEDPRGIPANLMPYICQVAVGRREQIEIFGKDYPTSDGTGVRDYIHVMDLAEGHVNALEKIDTAAFQIPQIINLGAGKGYTVLEVLRAFEKSSGKIIPYNITNRRPGDIAACFADTSFARKILKWSARRSLENICADAWRWQSRNPKGYP